VFLIWKTLGSNAFSAADRNLLIVVFFFFTWVPWRVVTPTTYHNDIAVGYIIQFMAYFMMVCMFIPGVLYAYNYICNRRDSTIEMLMYYPRGIPFIIPIAAAFYITAVFGV
jgi:hypothetical protein